jgi:hypothetical protein
MLSAASAVAQRVLGIGDDAFTLPKGTLRVGATTQWQRYNERFTDTGPNGTEPLGRAFNIDSVGPREFEFLTPVQSAIRSLSGVSDFRLSIGRLVTKLNANVSTTPIVVEFGLTSRLTVALNVPYMETRMDVAVNMNPGRSEGNVGVNPTLISALSTFARAANTSVATGFSSAVSALQARLTACQQNPAGTGCGPINSNRPQAQALVTDAAAVADAIARVYGSATRDGMAFVPRAGTAAQTAINTRIDALSGQFATFLGAPTSIPHPFAALTPATVGDIQAVLTNPTFGIESDSLKTMTKYGIGDIELGAKFLLLDSFSGRTRARMTARGFNYRVAVGALYRFGTGKGPLPDRLVDIGTGDGQNDVELQLASDLLFGSRYWMSIAGRYGIQMADQPELRVLAGPDLVFPALYRQQVVDRQLGNYIEMQVTPRYVVNDYFALSAQYTYRSKSQDHYTGSFAAKDVNGTDVTFDASALDIESERSEQRVGGGITYSTYRAFDRGKTGLPIEVSLMHAQTLSGSARQPKAFTTQVQLRFYPKLFGFRPH